MFVGPSFPFELFYLPLGFFEVSLDGKVEIKINTKREHMQYFSFIISSLTYQALENAYWMDHEHHFNVLISIVRALSKVLKLGPMS